MRTRLIKMKVLASTFVLVVIFLNRAEDLSEISNNSSWTWMFRLIFNYSFEQFNIWLYNSAIVFFLLKNDVLIVDIYFWLICNS